MKNNFLPFPFFSEKKPHYFGIYHHSVDGKFEEALDLKNTEEIKPCQRRFFMTTLKTSRLILRQWKDSDLDPFAALNADWRVREYFPNLMSRKDSDEFVSRISDHIARYGWGLWAVSLMETDEFIGFVGLQEVNFQVYFSPAVEIGWRLSYVHWGKGYATEAAKASLEYGFEFLKLNEIVSFTACNNTRSRRVMEKIGMHHKVEDDFDHPSLSQDHPLARHVLYKMTSHDWFDLCYKDRKYVYKEYNPVFPDLFKKEKERILSFIDAVAIEHVGSTAVENLGGKGIIDIAICVFKEEIEKVKVVLQNLGYQYRPNFSTLDRLYFVGYLQDLEEGYRRYHIHLTYRDSNQWDELIGFRDYLRTHPQAVEEYASVKKHAADIANQDGSLYRKIKEPVFKKFKSLNKRLYEQ